MASTVEPDRRDEGDQPSDELPPEVGDADEVPYLCYSCGNQWVVPQAELEDGAPSCPRCYSIDTIMDGEGWQPV